MYQPESTPEETPIFVDWIYCEFCDLRIFIWADDPCITDSVICERCKKKQAAKERL